MTWLGIPLSDYEQHMSLPSVGQAQMLASELAAAVAAHAARSVAVVGCAGGNGFERLASLPLERVVGIDINPAFIEAARSRHARVVRGLELHAADIESAPLEIAPVDLVFAGLVLEYVDVARAMHALRALCAVGAHLVCLLQLPSRSLPAVSDSPYASLQVLGDAMRLHQPAAVTEIGAAAGFTLESERRIVLPSGKEFSVLTFAP